MITIDEKEFKDIMFSHQKVVSDMPGGEYVAGYTAAISDALTALKVSEKNQDPEKIAEAQ